MEIEKPADVDGSVQAFPMHIGGAACESDSGQWIESKNPYTGQAWARIPRGTAADAARAVKAARRAFEAGPWPSLTASDRGLLMHRLADLIAENAERLAAMEVRDNGKLMTEMLAQMRYLPRWFQYYGGLCDKVEGMVTPIDKPGMFHYVQYQPVGVVVAITPWNSPLLLAAWKLAPALAAGNTIVVKPSEHASTSMLALARLFAEAGFPPGVVNVVTGYGPEIGDVLVTHPDVARVAFTGGDPAGRTIYEAAARGLKPVSLELGGKSPNILFEDADIDEAVKGIVSGIFAASGQSCMAGSRLLVHEAIHDEVVDRLISFMADVTLGDPASPDTQMGPIATEAQLEKVLYYIDVAKAGGAHCALGGRRAQGGECGSGWFVEPTIFTGVSNEMRIAQEEIFGPVLVVIKFRDDDEAVALANGTVYGLAAGVWTRSLERAMTIPKRLNAGTVWVNAYRVVSYLAPFGGMKASGIGRENGADAIYDYLEPKSVFINTGARTANPFSLR